METKEYCKCGGTAGYLMVNGELVCQNCGGLSPKAKLVGEKFVSIGGVRVVCPKCGCVIVEAREEKMAAPLEDKMASEPENKQVWPAESKRIKDVRKKRR